MTELESLVRAMTKPRGGAYPRPWTTDTDPSQADVLIVGASSARTFRAADLGSHDQFLDALWNRNGQSCRAMYVSATSKPSRTRPNLDRLSRMLAARGLTSLQTNVSCTSASYDAEVTQEDRVHGTGLFKAVVAQVSWRAMIVYGIGASKRFGRAFGVTMPPVPSPDSALQWTTLRGKPVFVSPTLAPPSYRTSVWPYLERVVGAIADNAAGTGITAAQSNPLPTQRRRRLPSDGPTAIESSAAHQLVRQRMQAIAETSSLKFDPSTYQASLAGGPERSSTTRVFRHKFRTAIPDLLVREDVFQFDSTLRSAAVWTTHKTPVFRNIRTGDLRLLGRILDAVEAFAAARAPRQSSGE